MEKKNKFLIILAIILFVLVICLGGYVVYDKVFSENKKVILLTKMKIIMIMKILAVMMSKPMIILVRKIIKLL